MSKITIKKSVLLELMKKSGVDCKKCVKKSANDTRFEEFKKQILEHLDSLEKDENELKKSLIAFETTSIEKAGYPVGTIREWKGKKYIKIAPNKWRPKYDSNTRGAKMAVAALKRKAAQCTDSKQLLQLILENRERFSDRNGRPLPFVKELSDYVSGLNDKIEAKETDRKNHFSSKYTTAMKKIKELGMDYKNMSDEQLSDAWNSVGDAIDYLANSVSGDKKPRGLDSLYKMYDKIKAEKNKRKRDKVKEPEKKDYSKMTIDELHKEYDRLYQERNNSNSFNGGNSEESKRLGKELDEVSKMIKEKAETKEKKNEIEFNANNFSEIKDMLKNTGVEVSRVNSGSWEGKVSLVGRNASTGENETTIFKGDKIRLKDGGVEIVKPYGTTIKIEPKKEPTEEEKQQAGIDIMKQANKRLENFDVDSVEDSKIDDAIHHHQFNAKQAEKELESMKKNNSDKESIELKQKEIDLENGIVEKLEKRKETEEEKHRNRSEAMKGNKNAYKGGSDRDFRTEGKRLLKSWTKQKVFDEAKGKTREEIFNTFDDEPLPIAALPDKICSYFGIEKNTPLLCSQAYFVDHMVNHHPTVDLEKYNNIQGMLDEANDIYFDEKTGSTVIVSANEDKKDILAIKKEDDKIVFYKTFYDTKKKLPSKFKKISLDKQGSKMSGEDEHPSIGRSDESSAPASGSIVSGRTDNSSIPQSGKKSSGISAIRDKYKAAKSVDGDDDTITLPDGTELEGKWKLVEADAPSASHDEMTFQKTEGFPANDDGSTINDRDYEHDSAAKEAVIDMSADFDSRALHIDSPVVVSEDGVVISGNNRTMSSKLAARKGTDTKYIEALNKKAKKFGFTSDDVSTFKNPRVVFETNVNGKYSTKQFAKFNQSGKKAQSPVETAVKIAKTVNAKTVESVAEKINQYDTLGELYADNKSMRDVFNTLIESELIKKTDLPAYYTDESGVTSNGKEFLETVLVGSVINESNIRSLASAGGKEIRQKLVRAIVPLVENKGMKGYSISKELNEAVSIAVDIKKNKKFKDAEEYSKQGVLIGEKPDPIAIEFAKKLEGTQKEFAEFMRGLNGGLRPAANGEADIFLGGVESRDEILSRYMTIKKAIGELFSSFFK